MDTINDRARELLKGLGLLEGRPGRPGYALSDNCVVIHTPTLVEWLERIDPVEQARIAIRAVYRSRPMDEDDFEEAVDVALNEVRGFLSREPQQPPAPPVEQAPSADGVEF